MWLFDFFNPFKRLENLIIMNQAELIAKLDAINTKTGETKVLVEKVASETEELLRIIRDGDVSEELSAAADRLEASMGELTAAVQSVDDKVPDDPPV